MTYSVVWCRPGGGFAESNGWDRSVAEWLISELIRCGNPPDGSLIRLYNGNQLVGEYVR
jgi:hypothetical protein